MDDNRLAAELKTIGHKLARLLEYDRRILQEAFSMAIDLDTIMDQLTEETDLEKAIMKMMTDFAELVKANAQNPAKLLAISDKMTANVVAMKDAILAGTTPPPPPPV